MNEYKDVYSVGDIFSDLDTGDRFDDVLANEFEIDSPEPDEMALLIEAIKDMIEEFGMIQLRNECRPSWLGCDPTLILEAMIRAVKEKIKLAARDELPEELKLTNWEVINDCQALYRAISRIKAVVRGLVEG